VKNLVACLLVVLSTTAAVATGDADAKDQKRAVELIDDYRQQTWRLQHLMGQRRTPSSYSERRVTSEAYHGWVLRLWKGRAVQAAKRAARPPHRSSWLCLHSHEGPWKANTGNGYYGGLQMDVSFQRTYGAQLLRRKGTANRWTPVEQMWVAERALRAGRGFYPWPNAARACGLI